MHASAALSLSTAFWTGLLRHREMDVVHVRTSAVDQENTTSIDRVVCLTEAHNHHTQLLPFLEICYFLRNKSNIYSDSKYLQKYIPAAKAIGGRTLATDDFGGKELFANKNLHNFLTEIILI
jgi:hypothetical protein